MEKATVAPSRWHYLIGAGVFLVGVIVFAVFLVTRLAGSIPEVQVVVPGEHEINLAESGQYTVFYEYRSVVDSTIYLTGETLSGMQAMLKSKDDSQVVALSRPSMSSSYEVGGRTGVSVLEFEIDKPGAYVFTADYAGGTTGPEVVLAIGQFGVLSTILGGLGIFFGALIIGGFICVRAFLKRRKAKKEMMASVSS